MAYITPSRIVGSSNDIPDVTLDSNSQYLLTITLPTPAWGWANGLIYNALKVAGINVISVDAEGNSFYIRFLT